MFKFLWLIFFAGIFVSMIALSVLRTFREIFTGSPRKKQQAASQNRQKNNTSTSGNRQSSAKKKVITSDEGEYVDYEEIK
ncbi:MAG: DUF4834 family protein [Tannerella sp.]|jgi:hypothetical protein|nr:DUF4834 family protein [Tannerella sp.]